ncbi:carbohydrate ABC transporter permease [Verminephrobacter eiseniae]|uniref:Binding-protein-dependent transport systems inner membrane component n=1 Tax=Verminephrobacter eiseniae (strain EF01-2) TaxID=391735 RepID=A1WRI9_VEREI|nr:sugar ABC transporter permease [Verminephrobacter eiseniae]ABM60246.1 binding-protein-dependent transport systems inner membrane component [Verminephrobacter eiseniae EF01-2]
MSTHVQTRARHRIGLAPLALLALLLYAAFLIYPLVQSFITSLTNRNVLNATNAFIGFANFAELVHDERFLRSLGFTLVVVLFVTVVSNIFGLLFAMLLNGPARHYKIMRTLVFIPQVLSGVIVAFIWRSILTENGLLNSVLQGTGLTQQPISWLGTPALATLSICVVVSWMTIAFTTVVYTAALQSVPAELHEAARMDGAGPLNRFCNVTLPMIAPGTTISVTLTLITTLKLFDVIAVLTGGGPANSTKSVAFYLIDVAFTSNRFGYASAIAMVLLALTAVLAYGVTYLLRRREAHL